MQAAVDAGSAAPSTLDAATVALDAVESRDSRNSLRDAGFVAGASVDSAARERAGAGSWRA